MKVVGLDLKLVLADTVQVEAFRAALADIGGEIRPRISMRLSVKDLEDALQGNPVRSFKYELQEDGIVVVTET